MRSTHRTRQYNYRNGGSGSGIWTSAKSLLEKNRILRIFSRRTPPESEKTIVVKPDLDPITDSDRIHNIPKPEISYFRKQGEYQNETSSE